MPDHAIIKACPCCKETKAASEWYKSRSAKSGLFSYCIQCVRTKRQSYDVKLRQRVVAILGGKCSRCGFTDIRALQVDHVNGGGSQEFKKRGNRSVYAKIDRGKELENYQILCANCNWIKRSENREHGNYFKEVT